MIQTKATTKVFTHYFEEEKEIYPCRCGKTHEDFYDWAHHNCDHDDIVLIHGLEFGYCAKCGKTINIIDKREDIQRHP